MGIPSGWYFCEESSAVRRGQVVRRELFGQALALWRTESGVVHVTDAACPHFGSDLGTLGKVRGEHLQCFSHDYEFDGGGNCVKTRDKELPCRTKKVLYSWPVHEIAGFILVYYDRDRRLPTWRIPDAIFEDKAKGPFVRSQFVFNVGVDLLNEDNFDVGHLYKWHELTDVASSPARVDGPTISVHHDFKRHSILFQKPLPPPLDILTREVTSRYGSTLYGHGLTYSYIDLPAFDFRVQDFIFATPLGPDRTLYTTFLRRVLPEGRRSVKQRVVDKAVHPLMFRMFLERLRREHRHEGHGYWEKRSRVSDPILTRQERILIDPYREWCKQFEPTASEAPVSRLPIYAAS